MKIYKKLEVCFFVAFICPMFQATIVNVHVCFAFLQYVFLFDAKMFECDTIKEISQNILLCTMFWWISKWNFMHAAVPSRLFSQKRKRKRNNLIVALLRCTYRNEQISPKDFIKHANVCLISRFLHFTKSIADCVLCKMHQNYTSK